MSGKRFGNWLVVEFSRIRAKNAIWVCKCDCGSVRDVIGHMLRSGLSKSCGCLYREANRLPKRHGKCFTSEYNAWQSMLVRCYNRSHKSFPGYGGRGITVCDEWNPKVTKNAARNFLDAMGKKPSSDHSLERVDNSLGYNSDNCIWGTREQQGINRRNVLRIPGRNRVFSIGSLARAIGRPIATVRHWALKGKDAEWIADHFEATI
jgi:hypothetical protein